MFNLQEFQDYVQMNLGEVLAEQHKGAAVSQQTVRKNNGTQLHAILVGEKEASVRATIYLEDFFDQYEKGVDLDSLMSEITELAKERMQAPEEIATVVAGFTDYEVVKDKVIMTVVNTEKNQAMLAETPHRNCEDLSIIYKVLLGEKEESFATITVKNDHMKQWGITEDVLHEIAEMNTKELLPTTMQTMEETMRDVFMEDGMPEEMIDRMMEEVPIDQRMYVISNQQKFNGAVTMFYEEPLLNLANQMGTDLFILPSSIHECIAISTNMGVVEELAEMVREINSTQVDMEDQLSDHVYHFSASTKTLSLADTTMEELQSKVSEHKEAYETERTNAEVTRPRHHR